jgi:hypothetical protein
MAKEPTLGDLIDKLDKTRETYRALKAKADEVNKQYKELEDEIKGKLINAGIERAAGKRASVTLKSSVVGNITDYDTLCTYIKKTGYFHLLNRAVNVASFRELYEQALAKGQSEQRFIELTGLAPFKKIALNHDSLK